MAGEVLMLTRVFWHIERLGHLLLCYSSLLCGALDCAAPVNSLGAVANHGTQRALVCSSPVYPSPPALMCSSELTL